jgi:hypothetical protein
MPARPERSEGGSNKNLKLKIGAAPFGREKSLVLLDKLRSAHIQPLFPVNWIFPIFIGHF